VAKTLAWIGDAAINLAVIFEIWEPLIAKVGILTNERKKLVENSNLARLCDKWNVYDYRIHFDPQIDPKLVYRIL
jgi:ribonuclease-3